MELLVVICYIFIIVSMICAIIFLAEGEWFNGFTFIFIMILSFISFFTLIVYQGRIENNLRIGKNKKMIITIETNIMDKDTMIMKSDTTFKPLQ